MLIYLSTTVLILFSLTLSKLLLMSIMKESDSFHSYPINLPMRSSTPLHFECRESSGAAPSFLSWMNPARFAAAVCLLMLFSELCSAGDVGKMALLGKVKPKHSSAIARSPWGIQVGSLDVSIVKKASEIGVKWTRLQASWSAIEKQRGVYDWQETDSGFATAIENGITPFVCIGESNKLYLAMNTAVDPKLTEIYGSHLLPPPTDSAAMKAWLAFVGKVIERYKDKIKYWEVWNEPNHFAYWGDTPSGKEYGRLLNQTAKVIKSIDPEAKVLAGAMAGLDPEFTDDFLGAGNASLVDIITFHNYGAIPEERIYKALQVWDVINKHNSGISLWQGECGYPSHSSTRDFRGISPWGPLIQAKWLLRQAFVDTYFCRASMSNYFKLVHLGGRGEMPKRSFMSGIDSVLGFPERGGSRVKVVGVNEKCLLENPGLAAKPAFFTYQNLCAVMDSRYKPYAMKSTIAITAVGTFYGIGSEDDAFPSIPLVASYRSDKGKALIAYWLPWHPQELIRTGTIDLTIENPGMKKPVLVDLLDGRVYQLARYAKAGKNIVFKNIPLADYPMLIVERDEVEIDPAR